MAVGLEDGTLYVFQSELIRRRFDSMNSGAEEGDSHRLSMLDKLRRLRDLFSFFNMIITRSIALQTVEIYL